VQTICINGSANVCHGNIMKSAVNTRLANHYRRA
jgi:hypothetical protein